jgi:hypothetical protein
MKYGLTLIILGLINFLAIFSGLPTTAKKAAVVFTTTALVLLGWVVRSAEKRRQKRLSAKKDSIETGMQPELSRMVDEITEDISNQVDERIERLTHNN